MTVRQYRRLQRWERATTPAYNAGVMDGMDLRYTGYPRPCDPDEGYGAPFDLRFVIHPRERWRQAVVNHNLARERGRVDGYDMADEQMRKAEEEDQIEQEIVTGLAEIEAFLGRAA